jgi:hypothetical protein
VDDDLNRIIDLAIGLLPGYRPGRAKVRSPFAFFPVSRRPFTWTGPEPIRVPSDLKLRTTGCVLDFDQSLIAGILDCVVLGVDRFSALQLRRRQCRT